MAETVNWGEIYDLVICIHKLPNCCCATEKSTGINYELTFLQGFFLFQIYFCLFLQFSENLFHNFSCACMCVSAHSWIRQSLSKPQISHVLIRASSCSQIHHTQCPSGSTWGNNWSSVTQSPDSLGLPTHVKSHRLLEIKSSPVCRAYF